MPKIEREFGQLYYRVRGKESRAVVLLHDFFGTHESWLYQQLHLSRHCLTLAPDLRGHGRSILRDGTMTVSQMADDVIAMLDDVGVDDAHLVGCSHGGVIGLHLARTAPDRIASIVVTSVPEITHPDVIKYGKMYLETIYPSIESDLARTHGNGDVDYVRAVLRSAFEAILESPHSDHQAAIEQAGEISVPALVLGGSQDPVMPPDQALKLASTIPGAELGILPAAGHLAHRDFPSLYTEIVLDHVLRNESCA
jgi:3-oxoadipate enol-lactonase